MTVVYRLEPTGATPSEVTERLLTQACPSCGADWSRRGSVLPRGPQRSFLCATCHVEHEAQEVDADGRPVRSPGWGLARELAERDEDPDPTVR